MVERPAHVPASIPLLSGTELITDEYCEALKAALDSDGCTYALEVYPGCCVVHDLACDYGIDPWGKTITQRQADVAFRDCIRGRSPLRRWSLMALWRWAVVRYWQKYVRGRY